MTSFTVGLARPHAFVLPTFAAAPVGTSEEINAMLICVANTNVKIAFAGVAIRVTIADLTDFSLDLDAFV